MAPLRVRTKLLELVGGGGGGEGVSSLIDSPCPKLSRIDVVVVVVDPEN